MLSIAMCDDVAFECADLAKRIEKILEKKRVSAIYRQFYTGKDLLNAKETFDIIFLDIKMPELNGMDLAKLLREKMSGSLLIFVTFFKEYVFEAYEVEAFRYLVKPIEQKKLEQILEQAIEKLNSEREEFLVVSSQRNTKKIWLRNIIYMESLGRIVRIHSLHGVIETYEQIGRLEKELKERAFFRCHKSYLVNMRFVDTFDRTQIVMENGDQILLAKRRYHDFAKEMLGYLKREGGIL